MHPTFADKFNDKRSASELSSELSALLSDVIFLNQPEITELTGQEGEECMRGDS